MEVGDHLFDMANDFFQSSFALRFQEIKNPPLFGRSVGNKLGIRGDTRRSERAARRGILVDTEPRAQSTYSVERGDGDTSCSEVENPLAHLVVRPLARRVRIVCNIWLDLNKQNGNFPPRDKVYHTEIDRAGDAFELRSNLVVLGSREELVKEGIEWPIVLAFVGSELVNEFELKGDKFRPRHLKPLISQNTG